MINWHSISKEETAKILQSSIDKGLSQKEVLKRQKKYGLNILEAKKKKSFFIKFFQQFADFMIITLICAAFISFFVSFLHGKIDLVDPIIILLIITVNAFLGVFQELKAEKSLEALQKLSAPTALVLRDYVLTTVNAKELVPGDIIFIETGHFIPADARLISAVNLKVDEASLTGESHPVEKNATVLLHEDTLLADRHNMVMSTCIVTYGRGTAIVTSTGMHTEVGHIAKLIMEDEAPMTPLQKRLANTGKILGIAALFICIFIFLLGILKNKPVFDMFMTSVSLAVAAIPEGLPAIVTIMLSLGVQRMAKKNAVIRKLPAVETLGSATVICSDKTGTLTQNKMTVTDLASIQGKEKPDSIISNFLLTLSTLCNDSILQITGSGKNTTISTTGEPTEQAFVLAAYHIGLLKPKLDISYPRIYEIPFDSTRKLMTTVHKLPTGEIRCVTKGAFDFLIMKCTHIYHNGKQIPLTSNHLNLINKHNLNMTERALRVIAVAYKDIPSTNRMYNEIVLNENLHNDVNSRIETGLTLVGLIGMIDPPRKEVAEAVLICKAAGITPIMITGDHITTACAIAKELGIMSSKDLAMTGAELSQMDAKTLSEQISQYRVFARVSPEHKVRIVKAFQARGEVVAMTGDGVNDAPALKAADIGCAMGISGTDVAKNAADMILTDDNFATIVSAVREGRGIYDNIKKAIHFLLSCNIGEIITIFIAILLGLPSPLLAVQLLWVNLVTDSLPAISLGVEPAAKDIMKKKPIPPDKGMFADGLVIKIIAEGIMIGLLSLLAFIIGIRVYDSQLIDSTLRHGNTVDIATHIVPNVGRTMAFAVLSLSQLFHSFNMRSEHSLIKIGLFSNMKLLLSFFICAFLQVIVISLKPLATIFKVVPLNAAQWSVVILLSFMPIVVVELQKSRNHYSSPTKYPYKKD